MNAFVAAGAGFLLAVLWFDLMFDVQMLRHRATRRAPDEVLASISAYYRRVTTAARPMNRLIAAVMIATLIAIVVQIARDEGAEWVGWLSLLLAGGAVSIAAAHTVPAAVRLGTGDDPPEVQSGIARSVLRDHLACFAAIAVLLMIQLGFGG